TNRIGFNRNPVSRSPNDVHTQIALTRVRRYLFNHATHRGVPDRRHKLRRSSLACRWTLNPRYPVASSYVSRRSSRLTHGQFEIHRRWIEHKVVILIEDESHAADHVFPVHRYARWPSQKIQLVRLPWLYPENLRLIATRNCSNPPAGTAQLFALDLDAA